MSHAISHDAFNNLTQVELPDGTLVSYLADSRGRRVSKSVDGVKVQGFLYQDKLNPVAELDGTSNVVSRFVYGTKGHVPDFMLKDGQTYRLISDHLGSVRLVINSSTGTVAQRLDYDEYGNVLSDSNPGFQPFAYAGGLYDVDTGLVRFGARDYDAAVGRWVQSDPIGLNGGMNTYTYVGDNPVFLIDPEGLFLLPAAQCAAGALGGYLAADAYIQAQNKRECEKKAPSQGDTNKPLVDARNKVADAADSFSKQAAKGVAAAALLSVGSTGKALGLGCSALGAALGLATADGSANTTVNDVKNAIAN